MNVLKQVVICIKLSVFETPPKITKKVLFFSKPNSKRHDYHKQFTVDMKLFFYFGDSYLQVF